MNTPKPMPTIRPHPLACSFDAVHEGIMEIVRRNHRPGETDFETASRMLVNEALGLFGGSQARAAKALGISGRRMNYLCENLGLRPMDAADAHSSFKAKRGRKPEAKPSPEASRFLSKAAP